MSRFQDRGRGGRFHRNTLANICGLKAWVCAYGDCRGFNPRDLGEGKPTMCHHCGRPFHDLADGEPPAPWPLRSTVPPERT